MGLIMLLFEMRALAMLPFFTNIKAFDRPVIPHYAGVDQAFTTFLLVLLQNQQFFFGVICHSVLYMLVVRNNHVIALRAIFVFTGKITVYRTDAEYGRNRDIRELEVGNYRMDKCPACFRRTDALVHVEMEYSATRVFALELIL